jgi:hypothetical protein
MTASFSMVPAMPVAPPTPLLRPCPPCLVPPTPIFDSALPPWNQRQRANERPCALKRRAKRPEQGGSYHQSGRKENL